MQTIERVEVLPSVHRIVEGLRDTGYDFNAAIADIVDNSIAAQANRVTIVLDADLKGRLVLCIGDNGIGMNRDGLINAMRYGSAKRDDPASLGKFGLGLKTASTAFCRRLVVVSRSDSGPQALSAAWDLDYMAANEDWGLELAAPSDDQIRLLDAVSDGGSGTLIVWDKIDRVLNEYKNPAGKPFRRAVARLQQSLVDHLALVYQRFLDADDDRASNVSITVNSKPVQAWDPFALSSTGGPVMEETVPVELPSRERTSFTVRAFVLPRKEEFETSEERDAARISNDLQGIYVYRENRLIHGPDWLQMYKSEPHFSLLRVELSFDHLLDDGFQVDIKKSRILLQDGLYNWLRDTFLIGPRRHAEQRYRKGVPVSTNDDPVGLHQISDNTIHGKENMLTKATITSTDPQNNEIEIQNKLGQSRAKIRIIEKHGDRPVYIDTASSLENGVLWETAIIDGANGVLLNSQHPYYRKAYLPHKENSVIIQALDYLLWSLAQAELNNSSDADLDTLADFRIDVSRNLKRLVADLPDPVENDE